MSQTIYNEQAAPSFAGMIADSPGADMFIQSLASEDVANAAFGLGYMRGTDPETQFKLPAGAGVVAGVLAHRHQSESPGFLKTGETGDLIRRGRVWVEVNAAVTAGGAAFLVNAVADFGKFRGDVTNAQAVNGTFLTSTAGAGLAILEINEP